MANLLLFDTNILVHLIREDLLGDHIRNTYTPFLTNPKPFICVVSDGEIRSLALQWAWGKQKLDQMHFLLGFFRRVPIEQANVLQAYATIDAYSESIGQPMGKNDVWIAAATYITGARLITTDTDFDHLQPSFFPRDWIEPEKFKPPKQA
jgi:tRNA(fMet)-specific endonuclease VapC